MDLDASAGRGVTASAGVVWQLYRGATEVVLGDFLPRAHASPGIDAITFTVDDRQFLNHAYMSLYAGPVTVTAGKQHLAWGRGLVFNPTELFRPKVLYDPGYEREGVGALNATLTTGVLSDVSVVYVPGDGWRTSSKVTRLRTHVAGFDLSALAAELWEDDAVATLLGGTPTLRHRRTFGGDVSGEVLGLGVWAEGTWSEQAGDDWVELTVGGNATLPGDVLVNVEAFYDGRGRREAPYALEDWLAVATGERRTIGRGLLFTSLSRPTGDLLTVALASLANVEDGSAVLLPNARYSFAENVDLFVQAIVTLGPDGTEFGTRGSGALIRARVYF
ncbi:MAG: hypothetical protein R6U63_05890 [Longimicrobiales bacterium]